MTAHLRTLLEDPALAGALGAKARDRATTAYGREGVIDQIEAFYQQAVAESDPRRPPPAEPTYHAAQT